MTWKPRDLDLGLENRGPADLGTSGTGPVSVDAWEPGDLGNSGNGELGACECGCLGNWGLGTWGLGTWEHGDLGVWKPGDLGDW